MRILFATYSLAFQNPGGGEQALFALKNELTRLGEEVDVFDPWRHVLEDYDIIHYFSCLENSFWALAKEQVPKTPLFVTPVVPSQDMRWRIKKLRQQILTGIDKWFDLNLSSLTRFRLPDYWLPATESEKETLIHKYSIQSDRLAVLPNGVDSRFANADPKLFYERTGISGPFVLHVGRFDPVKNQDVLIEALQLAQLQGVFIGSPGIGQNYYYQSCLAKVKSGSAQIRFIPALSHDDPLLASSYAAASVFALPSQFETFSIASMEAALAGTRLVLTQNMMSKDIFEPVSTWVDPNNAADLAMALKQVIAEEKHKNCQIIKEQLLTKYSWPKIAEKLRKIYRSMIRAGLPTAKCRGGTS